MTVDVTKFGVHPSQAQLIVDICKGVLKDMSMVESVTEDLDYFNVVNNLPARTVRIATFGDSTSNGFQFDTTAANTIQEKITMAVPGSGTLVPTCDITKMAVCRHYPAAYLVANGGISGATTTAMLARDAAASTAIRRAISDVLDQTPDCVLVRGGSINDLSGATASNWQSLADTAVTNHQTILRRLLSGRAKVIDSAIYGYSVAGANLAYVGLAILRFNAAMRAYALANPAQNRYQWIDLAGITHDATTGLYLPNMTADGIHFNIWAGTLHGRLEAKALTKFFGQSSRVRYHGANLFGSQCTFATPSGGGGSAPSGYTWNASNCTRAGQAVVERNEQVWAVCEGTSPSAANPNISMVLPFNQIANGGTIAIVNGGLYGLECDYLMETKSGAAFAQAAVTLGVNIYDVTNTGRIAYTETSALYSQRGDNFTRGKLYMPPWLSSTDSTGLGTSSSATITFTFDQSQDVRVGISNPRLVKLN